jgi:hypothetical protein
MQYPCEGKIFILDQEKMARYLAATKRLILKNRVGFNNYKRKCYRTIQEGSIKMVLHFGMLSLHTNIATLC